MDLVNQAFRKFRKFYQNSLNEGLSFKILCDDAWPEAILTILKIFVETIKVNLFNLPSYFFCKALLQWNYFTGCEGCKIR